MILLMEDIPNNHRKDGAKTLLIIWDKLPNNWSTGAGFLPSTVSYDPSLAESSSPGLSWLSGPLSGPLDYVRELRARRPNLSLKCTGVVEAWEAGLKKTNPKKPNT